MKFTALLRICAAGALALACAAGCVSHEEPPPPRGSKSEKAAKQREKTPSKKKKRRDPMDDMFFGIGKRADTPTFTNESLSREEQSIVRDELRRQNDEMDALRQRHREYDSDRSKRQKWVYGLTP